MKPALFTRVAGHPGPELLPDLYPRAGPRHRTRAPWAAGEERRLHDLFRRPGVLRRLLRRADDGAAPPDRSVVRRSLCGTHHRRCGSNDRVGVPRFGRGSAPVQVRPPELLRDLPEPGAAARARRVLDLVGPDPGARPPSDVTPVHPV